MAGCRLSTDMCWGACFGNDGGVGRERCLRQGQCFCLIEVRQKCTEMTDSRRVGVHTGLFRWPIILNDSFFMDDLIPGGLFISRWMTGWMTGWMIRFLNVGYCNSSLCEN